MSSVGRLAADAPLRLPGPGCLDRKRPLGFSFDGKRHAGYAGDTVASALLASGVRMVGRSFKYHRPRGILTAGSEEPNALLELREGSRREANTRATVAELFDGLLARSQNRWPSLHFDVGAINSWLSPLFVAGFYYKTFMWPAAFWEKLYEPVIRRAAGLGRASLEPDPDQYEKAHAFCDVLIIGAGAAGLAAAATAGRAGARVILCDEDFVMGGRLNGERRAIEGLSASRWAAEVAAELESMPDVRVMRRTTVFGSYDNNTFGAIERVSDHLSVPAAGSPRQCFWRIVAKQVILAAGAVERPIVFGGNDLPGVMLASAVRTYVNRFRVTPGHRVAVFTTTDDGWRTAFDLREEGVPPVAVIDARKQVSSVLIAEAKRIQAPILLGAQVTDARGTAGLETIRVLDRTGRRVKLDVDILAVSGGWNPSLALSTHLGGRPRWSADISAFVPGDLSESFRVAGAAAGLFSLADALSSGATAGAAAARATGFVPALRDFPRTDDELCGVVPLWRVRRSRGKAFVDFQHDVTDKDVELAAREGFRSVELLKRYTTLGMATDQGKTSSINGHAIMAALTERSIPRVGTTVSRPPYTPVAIGAFAGAHRGKNFKPVRLTSSHAWAVENAATFVEAGQWLRARWFAKPAESDWLAIVTREVQEVRSAVGVCDVSTLGKIDLQGGDAPAFLDFVYANAMSSLAPGKVRYGIMLREDGIVMDDGTVAHLDQGHYLISTTTLNAEKVMQHLEHVRQVLKPEWDVQLTSVTEQWAQFSLAGPRARQVLEALLGDSLDVSNTALPYMGCRDFVWCGVPVRVFRISFSGELAYELAVPARYGDTAIRAIMQAGGPLEIVAYGTEALGVMRIEKGHVAGNELNGTTTAQDLGLGKMLSTKKDFIGRVLAGREALTDVSRPTLVGIAPTDDTQRFYAGGHLLTQGAEANADNDQGFISSVAYSPARGHWVGLAFLRSGLSRVGERVRVYDPLRNCDITVEVCSPVFFDSNGSRLKV